MAESILIPIAFFAFVYSLVRMKHQQRLEEMRVLRGQGGGTEVVTELRQLQQQLHELRDTTTRYDMSFDAALQRLESRVGHLEAQQRETEAQPSTLEARTGI
jgi:hypothetical protein